MISSGGPPVYVYYKLIISSGGSPKRMEYKLLHVVGIQADQKSNLQYKKGLRSGWLVFYHFTL